jgi:hypothetical protein
MVLGVVVKEKGGNETVLAVLPSCLNTTLSVSVFA